MGGNPTGVSRIQAHKSLERIHSRTRSLSYVFTVAYVFFTIIYNKLRDQ